MSCPRCNCGMYSHRESDSFESIKSALNFFSKEKKIKKLQAELAEKDKVIAQAVTLLTNASNQLAYVNYYRCDDIDEFIDKHYKQKDEVKYENN